MKKFLCLLLIGAMLFGMAHPVYASAETINDNRTASVYDILGDYQNKAMQIKSENAIHPYSALKTTQDQLKQETINELKTYGYHAYDVNFETYTEVEQELHTDFSAINLEPDGSYIVVVSGEDPSSSLSERSSAGNQFIYTAQNGRSYTMRYLTITAADNSNLGQLTEVDLLNSNVESAILNCLNTVVNMYISYSSATIGTIASICGLSIEDFLPSRNAIFKYTAGSNWTQTHTQVMDETGGEWFFGSCVTQVYSKNWVYYAYYNADSNAYVADISNQKTATLYSPHHWDLTWRKEQAIIGSQWGYIYDATGDVQYKYGSRVLITHSERTG